MLHTSQVAPLTRQMPHSPFLPHTPPSPIPVASCDFLLNFRVAVVLARGRIPRKLRVHTSRCACAAGVCHLFASLPSALLIGASALIGVVVDFRYFRAADTAIARLAGSIQIEVNNYRASPPAKL